MSNHEAIIQSVRRWLESIVIEWNLCPFAKKELVKDRIRFFVSEAADEEGLLQDLQSELNFLKEDTSVETTLLIHPQVLQGFDDYNQFLDYADGLLAHLKLEGVFQIASFHPDYRFQGTEANDAENYTNRSPYPLLHILREKSLERVIAAHPDTEGIPLRNIEFMKSIGTEEVKAKLRACKD